MIKANDLRLNNWVYVVDGESTPKKTPVRVNLTWMQIPEALEPIPLTECMLIKSGFVKDLEYNLEPVASSFTLDITNNIKGSNSHWFTALVINQDTEKNKKGTVLVNYLVNGHWSSNDIKTLHQLQNLYYSLTNKELEVNLSEPIQKG